MEKQPTSKITIVFYIFGGIFLIISLFMLITAIGYTKTYLQSYDASFGDMWSHSLQYIIAQFGPYLGFGIVCLGIGKAIKEMRYAADNQDVKMSPFSTSTVKADTKANTDSAKADNTVICNDLADKVSFLAEQIEATREVLGVRIEEKEKRDAYRLEELGKKICFAKEAVTSEEAPILEEVPVSEEAPILEEVPASEEAPVIEEVPASEEAPARMAFPAKTPGPVPQIMRHAGKMAMPEIPTPITVAVSADAGNTDADVPVETISFDAFASKKSKRDTFSRNELEKALAREEALRELEEAQKEADQETK